MPFVRATYNLEGGGPLVLKCYGCLNAAVSQAHYSNLQATIDYISAGNVQIQQWTQYATSCVQPGLTYFIQQLDGSMKQLLANQLNSFLPLK
jgi:hypothetical protein